MVLQAFLFSCYESNFGKKRKITNKTRLPIEGNEGCIYMIFHDDFQLPSFPILRASQKIAQFRTEKNHQVIPELILIS